MRTNKRCVIKDSPTVDLGPKLDFSSFSLRDSVYCVCVYCWTACNYRTMPVQWSVFFWYCCDSRMSFCGTAHHTSCPAASRAVCVCVCALHYVLDRSLDRRIRTVARTQPHNIFCALLWLIFFIQFVFCILGFFCKPQLFDSPKQLQRTCSIVLKLFEYRW